MTGRPLELLQIADHGILGGSFVFLSLWEEGKPFVRMPVHRRAHIQRNVGIFLLGVIVLVGGSLLGAPFRWVDGIPGLLSPLQLSLVSQIAIAFIVADLVDYLIHRLLHRWRPFWLLHAVHHADPYVDVSTGLRHHPIEVAVQVVGKVGLYLALGIPLWIEAARTVMLNPMVLMQHANIRYPIELERSMAWLFVTPGMHRVHHLPDPQHTNCNFGQVFTIWDRLFGTYKSIRIPPEAQFGLRNLAGDSWQSVRGMLLTPLSARRIDQL